ncbi:MAG TPA: ABC transporter permease subunit [Hyphomicrobiaceae bacterium]|nr:ABC transporter permease subunit [Hyphomicrobiaceae bacterium]
MTRAGWIRLALIVGALLLLEAGCRFGYVSRHAVIPPTAMAAGAWQVLGSDEMRGQILLTLATVAQSIVLSIAVGFAIGTALHRLPRLRRALDPLLASYYAVPTFVFYPVFIVLFGLNRWPLVAIGFVFAVVAVIINTLDGLSRVPRALLRTAQVMKLTPFQRLAHVTLPAAAPWLFTGVKFAVVYSFIGVIAGEFVLSGAGIGFAVAFAYNSFDNRTMYGLILLLFVIVGGINMSLWSWEQRLYARRGGR